MSHELWKFLWEGNGQGAGNLDLKCGEVERQWNHCGDISNDFQSRNKVKPVLTFVPGNVKVCGKAKYNHRGVMWESCRNYTLKAVMCEPCRWALTATLVWARCISGPQFCKWTTYIIATLCSYGGMGYQWRWSILYGPCFDALSVLSSVVCCRCNLCKEVGGFNRNNKEQ